MELNGRLPVEEVVKKIELDVGNEEKNDGSSTKDEQTSCGHVNEGGRVNEGRAVDEGRDEEQIDDPPYVGVGESLPTSHAHGRKRIDTRQIDFHSSSADLHY